MRVPLSWLKEYVDLTVEPQRLGDDLTAVGLALEGLERDGRDVVLDFDVTTNRVDCMNVYGIAREAAVIYGLPLKPLELAAAGPAAVPGLSVEIEAPELCPRFCARVLDVRPGASPAWLHERLELVGVRPINNVVDLSNYVMMEMGHPSHAFDLERIPEGRLVVRWAREGERLVTLDGQERVLDARTGVVAGPREALALAGVMGGQESEVGDGTRTVALEAACWEPLAIRRAARRLGLHSEASHRFERGADFDGAATATARIAHLLGRLGCGSARPGLIDVVPRPRPRRTIELRPARVDALLVPAEKLAELGNLLPSGEIQRVLPGLGFGLEALGNGRLRVSVPGWRNDVAGEADLVEELGRHYGLARVPNAVPAATGPGALSGRQRRERLVRTTLTACGLDEAINYDFVSGKEVASVLYDPPAPRLKNPLSEELDVLRTSLVFPGLLRNLQTNVRQGRRDAGLFEIGRVFLPGAGGSAWPDEELRLGLVLAGVWRSGWDVRREADLYDLLGVIETLFKQLGLAEPFLTGPNQWGYGDPMFLHTARRTLVNCTNTTDAPGYAGQVAPALMRQLDLPPSLAVLVAEIRLGAILDYAPPVVRAARLQRFPVVQRDLSLVWSSDGPSFLDLRNAVERELAGSTFSGLAPIDRFEDAQKLGRGKVSLTLRLTFQHPERTLTHVEVQAAVDRATLALKGLGIEIRGV